MWITRERILLILSCNQEVEIPVSSTCEPLKRLADLGAMAHAGVEPGVAEPIPGGFLSVGETLTRERQDLAEFAGCSIEVLDDLEVETAGDTVRVKICGTYEDGSEMASFEVLTRPELEAARRDAVLARKTDTEFREVK